MIEANWPAGGVRTRLQRRLALKRAHGPRSAGQGRCQIADEGPRQLARKRQPAQRTRRRAGALLMKETRRLPCLAQARGGSLLLIAPRELSKAEISDGLYESPTFKGQGRSPRAEPYPEARKPRDADVDRPSARGSESAKPTASDHVHYNARRFDRTQVNGVVNFPPRPEVGPFMSEVLVLGCQMKNGADRFDSAPTQVTPKRERCH